MNTYEEQQSAKMQHIQELAASRQEGYGLPRAFYHDAALYEIVCPYHQSTFSQRGDLISCVGMQAGFTGCASGCSEALTPPLIVLAPCHTRASTTWTLFCAGICNNWRK